MNMKPYAKVGIHVVHDGNWKSFKHFVTSRYGHFVTYASLSVLRNTSYKFQSSNIVPYSKIY